MKAYRVTAVIRLQNQIECVSLKTGQVFYYKPASNISVACYRIGQIIALRVR